MKAIPNLDFAVVRPTEPSLKVFAGMLRKVYQNLVFVINGNLGFGDGTNSDNVSGSWINTTTPGIANTDFTVNHNLNRLPVGYWIMEKDRAVDIYTGSVAATKTQLTLRATVASAVVRLFVICLLFAFGTSAQTTNVTLQVTDSGGQSWNNGSWSVVLASPPGTSPFGPPFNLISGGTVPNQSQTGALSGTGSATMTLTQNSAIVPGGSQWKYTVCPQATSSPPTAPPVCFSQFVTITAVTTVTLTPPPVTVQAGAATTAYADTEVVAFIGQSYFNLTSGLPRVCTAPPQGQCTTWANAGGTSLTPLGNNGDLQMKNGSVLAASAINDNGTLIAVNEDSRFKGPNPWIDVTRYGVRDCLYNAAPCGPGLTANTNGTTSVTISSASTFINGDGVVCFGCGAPHSMSTPAAPTVTPSIAEVLTGTRYVVNGPTGSTTYNYQVFAEDRAGGLTAASPVGTTTTGAATLGSNTVNITSCSRSNNTVTCTTSSSHGYAIGTNPQMIFIQGASDLTFNGWYSTSNVADSTHFSFISGQETRNGASLTSTGGTLTWFNCNHITWANVTGAYRYWIVGRVNGSLATIGYSWPDNPTISNGAFIGVLSWDDFGATMMGSGATIGLPAWIPSTPPISATSDHLVTTIVSGAGTTSLTLANAAGTTVTGAGFRMDAVPGIKAAMVAATAVNANNNGTFPIYFPVISNPNNNYVINSFLDLTPYPEPTLMIPGGLVLYHTIQLPTNSKIRGASTISSSGSQLAFSYQSLPIIFVDTAYPGIYITNGASTLVEDTTITGNVSFNQNLLIVQDMGGANPGTTYKNVGLSTGSSNDYMGINILARNVNNGPNVVSAQFTLDRVVSDPGPSNVQGVSATPGILCTGCGSVLIKSLTQSHRGMYIGIDQAGGGITSLYSYLQGGIMPAFSESSPIGANASPAISYAFFYGPTTLDTDPNPLLANFATTTGTLTPYIFDNPSSNGASGGNSTYTGNPFSISWRSPFGQNLGQNRDLLGFANNGAIDGTFAINTSIKQALLYSGAHLGVGSTYSLFMDAPAMQSLTATVASGGGVPVGTHTYQIAPVWQNGGVGELSPTISVTTTTGNQTVNLTWTPTSYCKGYYINRDGGFLGATVPLISGCSTSSYSDTSSVSNLGSGVIEPAGGPTVLLPNAQGIVTPALTVVGLAPNSGTCTDANSKLIGCLTTGAFQNAFYVGPKCPVGNANQCYNANFDTQYAYTVTCNNTSQTITTGTNDPPFVAGDIGKLIAGTDSFGHAANCPPQGTITAFNSAHSVTVSNAATATATTGSLGWGHNDGAQIAAAFAASLGVGCLFLSDGGAFFDVPPFLDQRSASATGTPPCIIGTGNTRLTPLASFSYTNCITSDACVFKWSNAANNNPNYATLSNFEILGIGYNLTGTGSSNIVMNLTRVTETNVWVWHWGSSIGTGKAYTGPVSSFGSITDSSGSIICSFNGNGLNQTIQLFTPFCGENGQSVSVSGAGTVVESFGGQWGPGGLVGPSEIVAGNWTSHGEVHFQPGSTADTIRINAGGNLVLDNSQVVGNTANTFGAIDCNASGASVTLRGNTTIDGGASSGVTIRSVAGCNVINAGSGLVKVVGHTPGTFSLSGNSIGQPSETQTGSCTTNAATVTFKFVYSIAPLVLVSVTTSGSTGAQATSTNTTTATIHCNGASDAFVATVYPNPI